MWGNIYINWTSIFGSFFLLFHIFSSDAPWKCEEIKHFPLKEFTYGLMWVVRRAYCFLWPWCNYCFLVISKLTWLLPKEFELQNLFTFQLRKKMSIAKGSLVTLFILKNFGIVANQCCAIGDKWFPFRGSLCLGAFFMLSIYLWMRQVLFF